MFVEKVNWTPTIIGLLLTLPVGIWLIAMGISDKKHKGDNSLLFILSGVVMILVCSFISFTAKTTVRESTTIEYKLKQPLSINV